MGGLMGGLIGGVISNHLIKSRNQDNSILFEDL